MVNHSLPFVHFFVVSLVDDVVNRVPQPFRDIALRHHELIKFAIVGGSTMVFDMAIFYGLSLTILEEKPVIAKVISGVLATILSYILNREWAFKNRGGRERHHEALLFFTISGIGVVLAAAPLWMANNLFDVRESHESTSTVIVVDFVLNYIIGNLLQMIFRFWALRRFAFPDENVNASRLDELEDLVEEEFGHS